MEKMISENEPTTGGESPSSVDANSNPSVSENGDYAAIWSHHKVGVLIRRTKHYIVHINSETKCLDWGTSEHFDQEREKLEPALQAQYHAIQCDVAVLENRPCAGFEPSVMTNFRLLLGEALMCAFEHDFDTAQRMVTAASQYIEARSQELSRRWYLGASLACALPCAGAAILLWSARAYVKSAHGETFFWLLMASMAGATGALFSVLLRTGRLHFDCASGKLLHNLEGFSRILAGAIAGMTVALMLKAELIVQVVLRPGKEESAIILLALVSGVSERFAVSLIEKFEADQLKSTNTGEK